MKSAHINIFPDALLQTEFDNVYQIMNNVTFGNTSGQKCENIDAYIMEATANASVTEDFAVTHDLKRTPYGWIVLWQNASGDLYQGSGTNSATQLFLKCTRASTVFRIAIL